MKISHTGNLEPVGGFANCGKISGHDKIPGLESAHCFPLLLYGSPRMGRDRIDRTEEVK